MPDTTKPPHKHAACPAILLARSGLPGLLLAGVLAVLSPRTAHAQTVPNPSAAPGTISPAAPRNPNGFDAEPMGIQPVRPELTPPMLARPDAGSPALAPRSSLPFQAGLPDELIMRPPTAETLRQFQRFVPKIVDPQNTLDLIVGRPRILTFAEWAVKPQVKLYIPDEQVARWDILSDTEIAIVGLQPGTTVLTAWFNDPTAENGRRVLSYLVRVLEDPTFRATLSDLERQINELFPDSMVRLSIVSDRLVVQGQAKDAIEAGQILSLLAQTRGGRGGGSPLAAEPNTTVSQIFIDRDPLAMEDRDALRDSVVDPAALQQAGIVNLLQIPGEQQVSLRVTVAEVNRSALRSIGADMQIGGSDVSFLSLLSSNFAPGTGGNLAVTTPDFRLALNALRTLGYARTLAEPNLTTLNGRPAVFQAGDTFPVPLAQAAFGGVGQGVSFEFVGVQIQFVPYIVDRDRIRLQVMGQVSTRDDAQSANVGGTNVPGQNTRNFSTTVELRDGQTMALAGLLQNSLKGNADRVPLFGDLPVVGTLFSKKGNSASEQELVVLVTPDLVHPLDACQTPPVPGADVHEPTDVEFFLGNRLESRRATDFRSPVRTDFARIRQFEKFCHDPHIIGPSGHAYGCCCDPPGQPALAAPLAPAETLPPPKPIRVPATNVRDGSQ
ncbi:MAG: pilus assembly protein N-terminal domain-containing protein [Planctomycetales bacterium]|nr:pilus assembly protein N-terminal domain-containing protein [Planctomycetales bacterium]